MRFKIIFNITNPQKLLPVDYQYSMAAWIYKVIAGADEAYGAFLHKSGYRTENKNFKFFCFSPLDLRPFRINRERGLFELENTKTECQVSFIAERAAESYIKGIFKNQQCFIGDKYYGLDLEVISVEVMPQPVFMENMRYRALSPVCLSLAEPGRHARYLDPREEIYSKYFSRNLLEKARSMVMNDVSCSLRPEEGEPGIRVNLLSVPRSKLVTIKPGRPEETRVRCFLYDFGLTAPPEFQEIAYYGGFGEKNSMGFGCGEVI